MSITTSITPTMLEKGLNEVFSQRYGMTAQGMLRSSDLFKFTTLTQGIQEKDLATSGVGRFPIHGEEENVNKDTAQELGSTTYDIDIFANGVDISYKMMLGNRYDKAMEDVADLGDMAKDTQEFNRFAVLRNATTTTGYDGVALCATTHPLETGTASNFVNTAFSYDTLKEMVQLFNKAKNYRGGSIADDPEMLIVPAELWERAVEITEAELIPGSANNDVNFFSKKFPGMKVKWCPYIGAEHGGSNTKFYMTSRRHKMKVFVREALNTWMTPWDKNENIVTSFKAKYAEVAGFSDWRGVVCGGT